ncbi:uncharacterized protein LOC109843561 [Asparagus officinalis]|uniref:uncharacterized protein LOC109843561 n=1 Tax=Asparagus officinalis TaxID=4686 RepID=UPI00098DFA81|nr:uncharacterized protein LOC109843561 [Asparagus officinalis]
MDESGSGKDVKAPNLFERIKEEFEAITHKEKTHHKETHGKSNAIDEDTPIDKVKGPSVFERAKEEVEALIETVHPKKVPDHKSHPEKDTGCLPSLGKTFENICSPSNEKKD